MEGKGAAQSWQKGGLEQPPDCIWDLPTAAVWQSTEKLGETSQPSYLFPGKPQLYQGSEHSKTSKQTKQTNPHKLGRPGAALLLFHSIFHLKFVVLNLENTNLSPNPNLSNGVTPPRPQ